MPSSFSFSTPIYPPFGPDGEFAVWVDGMNYSKSVLKHRLTRRLNNMWWFEATFLGLSNADKAHVTREKVVKVFASNRILFRGTIRSAENGTDFDTTIKAYLTSSVLEKVNIDSTYTSTASQTVFAALVNTGNGVTLDSVDNGAFGNVTVRFQNTNRLKGVKDLCFSIDYDWWEEWGTYPYDTPKVHIKDDKGGTNTYNFASSGAGANMDVSSKELDTDSLVNSVVLLGSGDGLGQRKTEYFYATDTRSTLSAALNATATTVSLTDASSFPSSGDVWIGCEKVTYSGKSGNDLTGCTRGVAFMGNVQYTENVKADTRGYAHEAGIAVYDAQYTKAAPEAGTGMDTDVYGLHEASDTYSDIIDQNALDRMAQNIVDVQKDPVERIVLRPLDTFTVLKSVEVGDTVTATDAESGLSGLYKVVGIICGYDDGEYLDIELSNKRLSFSDDMLGVQEETAKLGRFVQGATVIYAVNLSDNCDDSKPLNLRFPLPAEIIGVTSVKLNFKIKPFRYYTKASAATTPSSVTSASAASYTYLKPSIAIATTNNPYDVSYTIPNVLTGGTFSQGIFLGSYQNKSGGSRDIAVSFRRNSMELARYPSSGDMTISDDQGFVLFYNTASNYSGDTGTWRIAGTDGAAEGDAVLFEMAALDSHTHTVSGSSHTHAMTAGIVEHTTPSGNVVVTCGSEGSEAAVGTYNSDQNEVDITQQVKDAVTVGTLSWLNCKFAPATELMRIEAVIYVEVIVRR